MKRLFNTLFLCTIGYALHGQIFSCTGGNQIEVSNVVCVPNDAGTADDFLTFTLEVTNNTISSMSIDQFPDGTSFTINENTFFSTSIFPSAQEITTVDVSSPSPDCEPVDFEFSFLGACSNQSGQAAVLPAGIPTLGQWGIIILSILSLICGIIIIGQNQLKAA